MAASRFAEMFERMLDKEFADSNVPKGTNLDLHWIPINTSFSWTVILVYKFLTILGFHFYYTVFRPVLMGR